MSDLYIKVDEIDLDVLPFDDRPRRPRVAVNGHSINIPVDAIQELDLDRYEEGIRELLRSVNSMDDNDKVNVFGRIDLCPILGTYTISEIRERYEAWKNRPKIGDEVSYDSHVGIIISYTKISGTNYIRVLANGENSIFCFPPDRVKKTGRHFDNISICEIGEYAEK